VLRLGLVALTLGALVFVVHLLTPPVLVNSATLPDLPEDLDRYLAERERAAAERYGLVDGTDKRIRWQSAAVPTPYAVVYLHGFSATRQAFAPTAELVADALGANLFETRLRGHGRVNEAMAGIRAEDWLDDAAEALAIGARLGDRIVLIGSSTGATLALAMARRPAFDLVAALVLVSPNFGPANEDAEILLGPAGPLIGRLLAGETHTWTPQNEAHGRYWTTSYPLAAAVEMMRLVAYARTLPPLELDSDLLVIFAPDDRVVAPGATLTAYGRMSAPRRALVPVTDSGDRLQHVLAGDALSPGTTARVAAEIAAFVRGE
jgi:pimeloyl-ACP methyl ester carboxylesterase